MLKKLNLLFWTGVVICISLLPQSLLAKEAKEAKDATEINDSKNFVDIAHQKFSNKFLGISRRIDRFFSGQRADDLINKSQLRLATITTFQESKLPFTEGRVRLNLVLPGTQEKLQLVIEGQGDNQGAPNNITAVDDASSTTENVQNTTTAALRFITDAANIKISADTGLQFGIPPKPFARLRFWSQNNLNTNWIFRPREEIFWITEDGYRSTTNLDFDRKFDDSKYLLRLVNRIRWNDLDYLVEFTNGPSFYHTIDEKRGISYHLHAITLNSPNPNISNYLARISYRQLLYKNWFFSEVSPQLEFPRDNNFHRTPSFAFKFEVVMGNI